MAGWLRYFSLFGCGLFVDSWHVMTPLFVQALWESDAYGCVTGTLHNSSLLMDESRSKINEWVAQSILKGSFKYLNFLEVNNVCDGGERIVEALNGF